MEANRTKFQEKYGSNGYLFTLKIECGICGKNYRNKDRNGRSTWVCSTHHKYGYNGCIAKPIYEEVIIKLLNKMLELLKFNQDKFKDKVERIKIKDNRIAVFILKDGKVIEKGMI